MNTILYLDNHYCSSINDVKNVLKKIENLESPLFHELRRAFEDGVLARWLNEGNEYEKNLSAKLNDIKLGLTNEKILNQFNKLFVDKDIQIQKPPFRNYFSIESISYIVIDKENDIYKEIPNSIFTNTKKQRIRLKFQCKIIENTNLDYRINVAVENSNGNITSRDGVTVQLKIVDNKNPFYLIDVETFDREGLISIYVDDERLKVIKLLNRPAPSFSSYCTPQQRKVINNILNSMIYVPETVGKFKIFDGEYHKATLTAYYISRLITDKDYDTIIYDSEYDSHNYCSHDIADIDNFTERLRMLSSLKYSLPSEAQWENAVKAKYINKSSDNRTEWTLDKWAPYSEININTNPVCTSSSGNYVTRYSLYDRSYDSRRACNYFRLVIIP